MKKLLLSVFMSLILTPNFYSQDWTTTLNVGPPPGAGSFSLGTTNCSPLDFYTRSQLRMVIDTSGALKIINLAGSGSRLLTVDDDGFIEPMSIGTNGEGVPMPCNSISPWVRGGNTVGANLNANVIGTCDNYDFILKAYDKKALFITAADSYVGIGLNNSSPTAQLDISDPGLYNNTEHLKIYGDGLGTIESTSHLNFYRPGDFGVWSGNYSTGVRTFAIDPLGRAGFFGNLGTTGYRLTVDGGNIDAFSATSTSAKKAVRIYNTTSSQETFVTLGDGNTTITTSNNNALSVFDAATSTTKRFNVEKTGKTMIGNESGATNAAKLNINFQGSPTVDAINVFDVSSTSNANDQVVFRVGGNGETTIGTTANMVNRAMLNVNVASANTPTAIEVFDESAAPTLRVNFQVLSNGAVACRMIKVTVNAIPDYVFSEGYRITPLSEIENYYKTHKHLPEVPSASELEKNGMDLGEMNKILLKKIEEITVLLVEQEKSIAKIKSELAVIKEK